MNECIFCKIVARELPLVSTYEDDTYLGFLDINPRNDGHSLLIPKEHHRWTYDVPNFGEYWEAARKVALATKEVTDAAFISFQTFGIISPHAHIHIIPMMEMTENYPPKKELDREKGEEIARKILEKTSAE